MPPGSEFMQLSDIASFMTPKQRSFAEHYALDHNGAAAVVRAGYARRSARQIASELQNTTVVQGAPEPATLVLLTSGLVLFGGRRLIRRE